MLDVNEVVKKDVAGNAHGDFELWRMLYAIACNRKQTLADRAKAVCHMDVLTGVPESDGFDDETLVSRFEVMAIELGMMEAPDA